MQELYSLENAQKFDWPSISGNLSPEHVSTLEKYLVGKRILDAGCGGGGYVELFSKKGLEVTGTDKYDEFLQVAREKGRLGTYVQSDITNLPFPDKAFDCTYCIDVLEHVDDLLAIKELARVTSKRLIIAVPQKDEVMNQFGLTFYPYQDPTHLRYYTETSLKDLALGVNCSNVQVFAQGFIPFHSLFREMLNSEHTRFYASSLRNTYKFKSSNFWLNKVFARLTDLLINRLINFESVEEIIFECQANSNLYKKVNISLTAIIDL